MSTVSAFEAHAERYDQWFERHPLAYLSELLAVRAFVPLGGVAVEVGVGGGRFAAPLGIRFGLDPSPEMLAHARMRGVETVIGRAEALPFAGTSFDHLLAVTTICFVDSPAHMLSEAWRVLKPGGRLVLGFIDRASALGREYLARQAESVFYRDAHFHSAHEVGSLLAEAGFDALRWGQTLSAPASERGELEAVRVGYGEGGFVVVAAHKPGQPAWVGAGAANRS